MPILLASAVESSSTIGSKTSDQQIFEIGECALFGNMIYGLVAPGYEMAEIVAANLAGAARRFSGADLSTKLKLMGVDVASFGAYDPSPEAATPLVLENPFEGISRKLLFTPDGKRLLGGILVGDASDYSQLTMLVSREAPLPCKPHELLVAGSPGTSAAIVATAMPDSAQTCSCNTCVAACHTLNGLDEHEAWRDVGLLVGGSRTAPVIQHITTAVETRRS